MPDRKSGLFTNYDYPLVISTMLISALGIVFITSAVKSFDSNYKLILIQSVALLLGFITMNILMLVDYQELSKLTIFLYGFGLLLLILVLTPLGTGLTETGGQSWFRFGGIGLQPAEIVKIIFIITFSYHLSQVKDSINELKTFLVLMAHVGIILGLILLQPDLGTALVFVFMFLVMAFVAGLSYKYYLVLFGLAAGAAPIVWFSGLMKDYQKSRILAVFKPEQFAQNYGYQVVQSKIAIGSGGIFGKGYFKGTQTQLEILPAKQTDFIFGVIGEEFGLIGCLIVIAILFYIIFRILKIGKSASDDIGRFICIGAASMLIFQIFENIGMCLGIMPVVGITLPFLSYGGSSLLANLAIIGFILNVKRRSRSVNG